MLMKSSSCRCWIHVTTHADAYCSVEGLASRRSQAAGATGNRVVHDDADDESDVIDRHVPTRGARQEEVARRARS